MAFATTQHCKLRAYRESDKGYITRQEGDARVARTAYPGYMVPKNERNWKQMEDSFLSKALLVVVIEVKREYAGLRKWDEDEEKRKDEEKTPQDWARELYAGYAALSPKHPKNRDAEVGITLVVPWWGNGFATEVTEWVLQHAFEQLALHRVSLGYFGNPAARRVYDKCGFVQEGVNRKAFWVDGHWVDEVTMGIIDEEYWAKKRALQP